MEDAPARVPRANVWTSHRGKIRFAARAHVRTRRKVKRRHNDPTVLITPTWTGDAPLRLDTKTIHGIFSNYFRALN